jgi:hypothetical protein
MLRTLSMPRGLHLSNFAGQLAKWSLQAAMLDSIFQSAYIAWETVIQLINFDISILLSSCGHASHRLFLCLKECHMMVLFNLLYLQGWGP